VVRDVVMSVPVSIVDEESSEVPSARDSEIEVTADRVRLVKRSVNDLADRVGVGVGFVTAGATGGVAFLVAAGAWYDVAFGLLCLVGALCSAVYYGTRPPVERTMTMDAEGVTDKLNAGDGFEQQRFPSSEIADVVMRPVGSGEGERYRVVVELENGKTRRGSHPIWETSDWESARTLVEQIRGRIGGAAG
jgi:hypothetical protein